MVKCAADSEAHHWPVVLASFVATSLTHGLASSVGVLYIEWHEEFPESSALIGWLSSSLLAMLLCFSPMAGALVKYFGVRPVVVTGGLLSFTGLLIASFAWEFYVLFITIPFMAGIGFGMSYTGVMVTVSEHFHKHYAMANGITMSGASVGMVLLPVFFQFLIDQYGWRRALLVTSALQANVLVCGGVMRSPQSTLRKWKRNSGVSFVPESSGRHQKLGRTVYHLKMERSKMLSASGNQVKVDVCNNASEQDVRITTLSPGIDYECLPADNLAESKGRGLALRVTCSERVKAFFDHSGISLFWTNRVFNGFMAVSVSISAIYGVTLPYIAARAKSVGVPELEASLLVSVIGISNMLSRLTHGRLLDSDVIQPAYLYVVFVLPATVAGPVIATVQSFTVLVVSTVLIGLAAGAYIPMQAVIIRRIVGKDRFPGGFAMGLVFVAVGNMASAAIAGYLADTTGSYSAGFLFMAGISGLCVMLMLGLHMLWTRLVPDTRWPVIP
ncbi:monocarboxylate transporter 13-like [Acanthaster planci]|uniref:Monocarboxylate transporter 13-like n=1 Tax=Acanthaster planci TaxID=133434 RepID=A0A8B7ZEC2_ACAPL|nr:monocarboxylate transporter 13-like [Acanthaster planci]